MTTITSTLPVASIPFVASTTLHFPTKSWQDFVPSFADICPSVVYGMKKCFGSVSENATRVAYLAENPKDIDTNEDIDDYSVIGEVFASDEFSMMRPALAKLILEVKDEQCDKVIKHLFKSFEPKDASQLIRRLQKVLELQKIESAIQTNYPLFKSSKDAVDDLAESVKRRYNLKSEETRHTVVRTVLMYAINTFDWFINMVVQVLHLKDTSQDDADSLESHFEAEMRFQGLIEEIQILGAWLVALYFFTGSVLLTFGITAAVAAVIGVSGFIYYKFFKPPPEEIAYWENLTKEATLGKLQPVYGREDVVQQIIDRLVSNKSSARKHVIITGPSGAGKNEILNRLVQRIVTGDVPEQLLGQTVYHTHASDLLASGGNKPKRWHLDKMPMILKKFRGQVILVINEVHVAFMDDTARKQLGDKLKHIMDIFPQCILITTDKEFEEHIEKDPAILRRVDRVRTEPLSTEWTRVTIQETALSEGPELHVTEDAIDLLVSITQKEPFIHAPQPYTCKDILATAIAMARLPKNPKLENELQALKLDRDKLESSQARLHGENLLPYKSDKEVDAIKDLRAINEKIKVKEQEWNDFKNKWKEYVDLVAKRNEVENTTKLLAMRLQSHAQDALEESSLQQFILQLNYLIPHLNDLVKEKAKTLEHVTTTITAELIQQIIDQKALEIEDFRSKQEDAIIAQSSGLNK